MQLVTSLALAGAACFAYGVGIERRWYARRRDGLTGLHIDRGIGALQASPLGIVLFSDLHFRPGQEHRLRFVLEQVKHQRPYMVISAGDNLEDAGGMDAVIQTHAAIKEALPWAACIAALGAHDRYGPTPKLNPFRYFNQQEDIHKPTGPRFDTDRFIRGLRDAGWIVPVNGQGRVATPVGNVFYSVVDDPHIGLDDLCAVSEHVPDDVVYALGITHAPYKRVLDHFVDIGSDLILAGHTHGGQVRVPFYGALVSNCDLPPAQARGLSYHRGVPLIVTAGLGHSTYAPFRFACRPEIRDIGIQ